MKRGPEEIVAIEDLDGQTALEKPTYQEFINSCLNGNLKEVEYAIQCLAPDVIVSEQNSALRLASKNGHLAVVNCLLEIEAVRNNVAVRYNSALCLAAENGHLDVVKRLLEIDAVSETAAGDYNTPLCNAARNGHLDVVKRLLEIDAVRKTVANNYNCPLLCAAQNGHLDVVNRLLEIEAVRNNATAWFNKALCSAAENGDLAVVNRLLEIEDVRNSVWNIDATHSAAKNGHLAVVNRLLDIDAVRDEAAIRQKFELLPWAAENGHLALVNRLLNIDAVREQAIVDLNLKLGADKSIDEQITILINHLAKNRPKLMKSLRNNEAQALFKAYTVARQRKQPSALLQVPRDIVKMIAKIVQNSSPPALQSDNSADEISKNWCTIA